MLTYSTNLLDEKVKFVLNGNRNMTKMKSKSSPWCGWKNCAYQHSLKKSRLNTRNSVELCKVKIDETDKFILTLFMRIPPLSLRFPYIYRLGQISLHSCLEQAYNNYFNKCWSGIVKDRLNMILLCCLVHWIVNIYVFVV